MSIRRIARSLLRRVVRVLPRRLREVLRSELNQWPKPHSLPPETAIFLEDEFGHLIPASVEKILSTCQTGMSSDSVPWMKLLAAMNVPIGGLAVDVGACVGQASMFLSKRYDRVLAFEPTSSNAASMKHAMRINNIANVDLQQCALAATPGRTLINLHESRGHHSLGHVTTSRAVGQELVSVSTIDLLVSDVIACLKIDVEGYETDVLEGAQESLRRGVDIIVLEVSVGPSRDLKRDPWAAVKMVRDFGYTCVRADGEPLESPVNHVDVFAFLDADTAGRAVRVLSE